MRVWVPADEGLGTRLELTCTACAHIVSLTLMVCALCFGLATMAIQCVPDDGRKVYVYVVRIAR